MTKRRVLVVEDNLDSVQSMAVLLKSMGHEVQFAIHGFAALEVARSFKPEVVLLDIGLPGFKGDEIARRFKHEPGLEKARIIAITGLPMAEVNDLAFEAGCEQVFAKPIDPLALEKLLEGPEEE